MGVTRYPDNPLLMNIHKPEAHIKFVNTIRSFFNGLTEKVIALTGLKPINNRKKPKVNY